MLLIGLVFPSCVEHLVTVRVLPDGRYTMKFVTKGDSTDVFNDDFPHPFGNPWTTQIATEIKDEETAWIIVGYNFYQSLYRTLTDFDLRIQEPRLTIGGRVGRVFSTFT